MEWGGQGWNTATTFATARCVSVYWWVRCVAFREQQWLRAVLFCHVRRRGAQGTTPSLTRPPTAPGPQSQERVLEEASIEAAARQQQQQQSQSRWGVEEEAPSWAGEQQRAAHVQARWGSLQEEEEEQYDQRYEQRWGYESHIDEEEQQAATAAALAREEELAQLQRENKQLQSRWEGEAAEVRRPSFLCCTQLYCTGWFCCSGRCAQLCCSRCSGLLLACPPQDWLWRLRCRV